MHSSIPTARQLVQACIAYGIKHVVISPGSRNAPLVIEFNAYEGFHLYRIVDERSAGFFALGMAKEIQKPVALVCTSGSALLNYYPAVAEAYNSAIPLLVLSADRPEHLIGVGEGQTIFQQNALKLHTGTSIHLSSHDLQKNETLLHDSLNLLTRSSLPVHINIAFDEPLYERIDRSEQLFNPPKTTEKNSLLDETPLEVEDLQHYADIWNRSNRKMILISGVTHNETLELQLKKLASDPSVVVLTENTANLRHEAFIEQIDRLIFHLDEQAFGENFQPKVLITFGNSLISKKIKHLLRKYPPQHHWHIDKWRNWDTFGVLERHFTLSPVLFFSQFLFLTEINNTGDYQKVWRNLSDNARNLHTEFLKSIPFSDLKVFEIINRHLPNGIVLELANSTVVRYAQLFSWVEHRQINANRGTSGIDGCTSTAVGVSVASAKPVLHITGDLAFFYDSNALWNDYIDGNLKIIVINNGGGGIFRFIPGPENSGQLPYFETPHKLSAKSIAERYGFTYLSARDEKTFTESFQKIWKLSKPVLLEVFTPQELNAVILREYFNKVSRVC